VMVDVEVIGAYSGVETDHTAMVRMESRARNRRLSRNGQVYLTGVNQRSNAFGPGETRILTRGTRYVELPRCRMGAILAFSLTDY
jgi:hypothetical protein